MMRHDIETLPTPIPIERNLAVNGGFSHREPDMRGFDVYFVVSPNKLLNKQSITSNPP